uniref:Uncharacterized protein n=1 Tax=Megaselia scalaris TaxID=36166 RepID=T1GG90_MEGSC
MNQSPEFHEGRWIENIELLQTYYCQKHGYIPEETNWGIKGLVLDLIDNDVKCVLVLLNNND